MRKLFLTVLFAVLFGGNSFAQDCSELNNIYISWECDCYNDQAFFNVVNANFDSDLEITANGILLADTVTTIPISIVPPYEIEIVAENGCSFDFTYDFFPETSIEKECLLDGYQNCPNDGDCSNGIETFVEGTCECIQVATIEGCVIPSACNYNPQANCPTECIFGDPPIGLACDDGDPNTVNDVVYCDGTCQGTPCDQVEQNCTNDGIDSNGIEVFNPTDCTCIGEDIVSGCTLPLACNYDPDANDNDGSCYFPGNLCQVNSNFGQFDENCVCVLDDFLCEDFIIQEQNFDCNDGITYTLFLDAGIDPTETIEVTGTGIAQPLITFDGTSFSFVMDEGDSGILKFTLESGCSAYFSTNGPVFCNWLDVGGPCDDYNPFTYNDTYAYYGCVGTPCELNEFACHNDGDCSNGFEIFDQETCQCISVGDCENAVCEFTLDIDLSSIDANIASVVLSQGVPNSIYTFILNEESAPIATDENGTATVVYDLSCDSQFTSTLLVQAEISACPPQTRTIVCGALPVTLIDFDGEALNTSNRLFWSTASENNSDQFILERSSTGASNWKAIANIAAAGNSSVTQSYELWDYEANAAINYYRLKERSLDGNISVASNIVVLERDASNAPVFEVYPNPTNNLLNINLSANTSQEGLLELRTMDGRTILRKQTIPSETINTLDLSTLSPGFYLLSFRQGDLMISQKVLKY